jgi:hypothetical protein
MFEEQTLKEYAVLLFWIVYICWAIWFIIDDFVIKEFRRDKPEEGE